MIPYTQGHLPEAPSEVLVNTVNTAGVMRKGIALLSSPERARDWPVHAGLSYPMRSRIRASQSLRSEGRMFALRRTCQLIPC